MSLTNIKKLQREKGFTIVELLIVIVVIAILAAIVLVAYNGIQNSARTTAAQSAAQTVVKKAEAYNAELGTYPTTFAAMNTADSGESYSLAGSGINFLAANPSSSAVPAAPASVSFYTCTGGGNRVGYYDYSAGAVAYAHAGPATSSTTCTLTAS